MDIGWRQRLVLAGALALSAGTASAVGDAGAYLAGRSAALNGDFREAAAYFDRASLSDPRDQPLLNTAITMHVAVGDVSGAAALAALAQEAGLDSRPAALVRLAESAARGRWTQVLTQLDGGVSGGPLLDGLARGWALVALDRPDEARAVFDGLAERPGLEDMARHHADLALASGDADAPVPAQGLATAFMMVADAIRGELDDTFTLLHLRLARHVDPGSDAALLSAGNLLQEMDRHRLSAETLSGILDTSPLWPQAALSRAMALRDSGAVAEALDLLERRAARIEDLAGLAALGDLHRDEGRNAEAHDAYARALTLMPPDHPQRWALHFARAVTLDRMDDWTGAEADLRTALAMAPEEPLVLNYLGYGLVDRGRNLTEALGLIRAAVALRPDDGAIVDSLGWALFALGDMDGAVRELERAVELSPSDPEIVDHLGDVYWAVGRRTEARFQWLRALGFSPSPPLSKRIEDKLADRAAKAALPPQERNMVTVANGDHPQTR
jgi:Flp pilus assembly protein TadD